MATTHPTPDSPAAADPLVLIVIGWCVPGAGVLLLGPKYRHRALVYALVIHFTFAIGMLMHGGVVWPVWNVHHEAFNIFNNLTFIVQAGTQSGSVCA